MKLSEVSPKNRKGLKVNKNGDVLCFKCKKELAWVCWGRAEPCADCETVDLIKGRTMH